MKRRIVVLLTVLAVALGLAPSALAENADLGSTPVQLDICDGSISIVSTKDTVIYTQGDNVYTSTGGCIVTQSDASIPASNRIDLTAEDEGALKINLTIAELNIESATSPIAFYNKAKVTLTLVGNNTLTCTASKRSDGGAHNLHAGIRVSASSSLVIQGNGSVTAVGGYRGAGIGGSGSGSSSTSGTITINSGTITAMGGEYGAGIGGGDAGDGGTITITGGTVTATGGLSELTNSSGAGIGGGWNGDGGAVVITGGSITAIGKANAAGIGGGVNGDGGIIDITGGIIVASGGSSSWGGGSGIGGGNEGNGGSVSIHSAEVTATGHYHAIGGGSIDNSYGCDRIEIGTDATISVSSRYSRYHERIDIYKASDAAAFVGNEAVFAVDAYGYSGITYQWQIKNGNTWTDLEGYTSDTAYIPVTAEDAGSTYRCKITNVYGNTVYTDEVQSYILSFSKQPESVETNLDEVAALSATSSCANVTYQWQRSYDGVNWADVAKQNSPTLVVTTTLSENGAYYRCIITATNGDWLASDPAQITVNTDAVTYSTDYFLEQADGSYVFVERITLEAETGASVSAAEKAYEHYVENTSIGTHGGTVASDSGLVLSRYYDRCEYTLSFEVDGGAAVAPITAKHGAAVDLPLVISRYGYVFDGWFLDEALAEEAQLTVMPTENTTLYAKWTAVGADRGTEYHINGITILGQEYEEQTTIPAGSFYAQVSVTNLSSETVDTLILAAYDENGKMLDLFFLYADPQMGQTFILGALIDNDNGEIAELRAFMIPVLGGPMVPLANSVSTADR